MRVVARGHRYPYGTWCRPVSAAFRLSAAPVVQPRGAPPGTTARPGTRPRTGETVAPGVQAAAAVTIAACNAPSRRRRPRSHDADLPVRKRIMRPGPLYVSPRQSSTGNRQLSRLQRQLYSCRYNSSSKLSWRRKIKAGDTPPKLP